MARFLPNLTRGRHGRRAPGLYIGVAVAILALAVFFLFRGESSDPQRAEGDPVASIADLMDGAPRLAVETETRGEPGSPASAPESVQTVNEPLERQVEATPPPAVPQRVQEAANVAAPEAQPDSQTAAAVDEVRALMRSQPGQVIQGRNRLNDLLAKSTTAKQRQTIKTELAKLSNDWLFGPAVFAGDTLCDSYKVKPGDSLQVIGRRNKVPYQILMELNNIPRPQSLQAGRTIKVIKGPFHVKVHRSTYVLDLYLQDMYVRSFKVGLGRPGYETPTGRWRVQEGGKLIKPTWTDPDSGRVYKATDPDYPLGSRWIALDGIEGEAKGRTGFAIHGTKDPDQIGTAGSRGCIRMYNGEAVLVYNLLFPLYSKVEVEK